jgi:uncharacterized protein (DUF983 family)
MSEPSLTITGTAVDIPTAAVTARSRRPVWRSIRRGFRGRCPNCGEGRLFYRYLKVVAECPACGEDLSHQRADDAPPYITIVVVGHIIVPLVLEVETHWHLPTLVHLAIWLPLTLILSLLLLQPVKGAVVGLQWALYMHGFDPARPKGSGDYGDPVYIMPGQPDPEPPPVS